ncbi:glycerol-3-phosphate cytidylyltransferase [Candidatus Methylomirabilis lanthanidiphila]|uniref:D-glycero-beta-D-manno-heptose 1-phosphate adenylyltransferase n=1 Tax=Candidatus Methylomirabilis lanthanidiphila TaxID=2211376 RepID=A0A564ZLD7_9BACT|nr:D-glycero-beta-D-manno-heptose 1-phosphate adenylyltransferase [Candidatus Methylomirabilis lanthanidiphila]VUZ85462.1 glycerol-3-phosphate cytidylyltransferase [Candidatus Methylomirabilis lanthanidiphila]
MTVDVGKLRSLQELVAIVRTRQALGERIVFTNGCFDLLHRGHTRLLQHAKALGNLLIVGLNSDASVRLLKGPSRPVLLQDERAELLSALASVDYVVIFEEADPSRIIAALEPDVLVKGADWTKDEVIGRETVERRGGQVVTIPLVAGCSTSRIVRRIMETVHPQQAER